MCISSETIIYIIIIYLFFIMKILSCYIKYIHVCVMLFYNNKLVLRKTILLGFKEYIAHIQYCNTYTYTSS